LRKIGLPLFLLIAFAVSASAQESDVLVTKNGPDQSAADTDVSYSVSVTNLGPDDTATLTLTDSIPAGMTFVSGTQDNGPVFLCAYPNPGDSIGTINCSIAALTAGSTAGFTFVFHIPPATPPGTAFTNIANAATATDPNSENDSATAVTVTPFPPQGDMLVDKTGPTGAAPDTDVVYTITVGNAGPDDASAVTLDDTLPGTMTFVSISQGPGPAMLCSTPGGGMGGLVSCTAATFPAGATTTFTLTGHIPAGTPSGTTFVNTATVTSSNDPNDENNSSFTVLTVASVDIGVVKLGPPTVTAGTNISYTITVSNSGPDNALGVTLEDPLPPNTTFVSLNQNNGPPAVCTPPGVGTNGIVSCNFASLANGSSAQFTLVIEAGNTTSATNTATVTTDSADSNPANGFSTVITSVTPSADLAVAKNGPATINAGANLTYTVTVTNNGPSDAGNVSLTDTLPADTTFVSATQNSGPAFSCITPAPGGTGAIACTIDPFPAAATATFTFVLHASPAASSGSSIANTAGVATTTADPNVGNNSSTSTATVVVEADVTVVKNGPTSIAAGTDITYNLTVTNTGPSDSLNVSLTDPVPVNTTFVSIAQTSGPIFACATPPVGGTGTITCTLATFPPGTAAFDIVLHVNPQASGAVTNTATVTSPNDPTPANNAGTAITALAALAAIPTLSPLALALMALSLAGIVLFLQRR